MKAADVRGPGVVKEARCDGSCDDGSSKLGVVNLAPSDVPSSPLHESSSGMHFTGSSLVPSEPHYGPLEDTSSPQHAQGSVLVPLVSQLGTFEAFSSPEHAQGCPPRPPQPHLGPDEAFSSLQFDKIIPPDLIEPHLPLIQAPSSPQHACADRMHVQGPRGDLVSTPHARPQLPRAHITHLPDEVLASILRRTLGSEQPARLCCAAYTRDLAMSTVLQDEGLHDNSKAGSFVRVVRNMLDANKAPRAASLPSIVVCKRWRRVILHHGVVSALAIDYPYSKPGAVDPCPLPSTLQLLMLRLDATDKQMSDKLSVVVSGAMATRRVHALQGLQGLRELKELVCCCPIDDGPSDRGDPPQRCLSWKFRALSEFLPQIPGLTRLDISHCKAAADDLNNDVFSLGHMTNLVSLSLRRLRLGGDAFQRLAPRIGQLTQLHYLDLNGNDLGASGLRAVLPCVRHLDALQTLDLQDNVLSGSPSSDEARALADCIAGLASLQTLCDVRLQIGSVLLQETVRGLASLPSLHTLRLHLCGYEHRHAVALFDSCLTALTTLRRLEVRDPRRGGIANGEALRPTLFFAPPPLTSLTVTGKAYSGLRDTLVPRLSLCTGLTRLAVEDAPLTKAGFETLVSQLSPLPDLQRLSFAGSLHSASFKSDFDIFATYAPLFTALRSLNLRQTPFSVFGSSADLAHALEALTTLTELDLGETGIGAEIVWQLAPALGALLLLEDLDLTGNRIGYDGAMALAPCLKRWPRLRRLALDYGESPGNAHQVCPNGVMLLAEQLDDEERLEALGSGLNDGIRAVWKQMQAASLSFSYW